MTAITLTYAGSCKQGAHMPVAHNRASERRHLCDCPCHIGNDANPWWGDMRTAGNKP